MPTTFEQLETQKAELTQAVLSWSPEQRLFQPSPDAWTAPQIVDHLTRTEAKIRGDVVANLNAPHPIGLRDRLGTRFIYRIFSSKRKVKVPASASAILPATQPDLDATLLRWANERRSLADLLAQNDPAQLRGGVFRHPIAGWMTLGDVLDFFAVHMRHHRYQLDRSQDAYRNATAPR